jgi:hypothetical protein
MISTLAIVIAGVSFIIVVVTAYRNLPTEFEIIRKSNHGEQEICSTTGANGSPPPLLNQQVLVVDNELNLIL